MEVDFLQEATTLKQSANNLELAISELQDRMISHEFSLRGRNAIIPATLSTADDIAVAFHIAVNSPVIDWPLAEMVLERYLFLGTKGLDVNENIFVDNVIGVEVWNNDFFLNNLTRLLQGRDCWRVRKSVELLLKMVGNNCNLYVSYQVSNSLTSILLQPLRSLEDEEETKWAYLIAKNQDIVVDHGVLRLINGCLYSQKAKRTIAYDVLKMISVFINGDENNLNTKYNLRNCAHVLDIPASAKILKEVKGDENVITICLDVAYRLVMSYEVELDNGCGISEALIGIMETYPSEMNKIQKVLQILFHASNDADYTYDLLYKDLLLKALVVVFNSTLNDYEYLHRLVANLCEYDEDVFEKFCELGISRESSFFCRCYDYDFVDDNVDEL
jgi:hypothetical protein